MALCELFSGISIWIFHFGVVLRGDFSLGFFFCFLNYFSVVLDPSDRAFNW